MTTENIELEIGQYPSGKLGFLIKCKATDNNVVYSKKLAEDLNKWMDGITQYYVKRKDEDKILKDLQKQELKARVKTKHKVSKVSTTALD